MSTGNFEPRSVASTFAPLIARGVRPEQTDEFADLVAAGMDPATPVHLLGWVDNFPARKALAATFAPPLAQAAPRLMGDAQDVLLYKAWREVLGFYPRYVAQQIGDCFLPRTPVRLGDGTSKPLADVAVGDEVITHHGRPRRVTKLLSQPYDGDMVRFRVEGTERVVEATANHPFFTGEGNLSVPASALRDGMPVRFGAVGRPLETRAARAVESFPYRGEVRCLEVEEDHSFLANGVAARNCTSFGSGHAVDLLQCVEIFLLKEATVFLEVCTEAIYGMGREIAGMLGGGDGCYGTAVAKALVDNGATTRKAVGAYSGKRAKDWGRSGVPPEVKQAMSAFKVGSAALITTLDELDASLANLYPSAGGFSQGFTMTRDADGVCYQSGRWGHEVCCIGRRTRNGKRQYCLGQSWGPNVPAGPLTDDQPDFSFWVDEAPMASILGQRDWLAFSSAPDFEKRPVPAAFDYASAVG